MAEHMCGYGNCHVTGGKDSLKVTITDNTDGGRWRYCSWLHAALGCLGRIYAYTRIDTRIGQAETLLSDAAREEQYK